jgi:hypothetical protein
MENLTEIKQEIQPTNRPTAQKSKLKKPTEKSKQDEDAPIGRSRAKTTIVSNFEKKPQAKKEIKPVQTIGSDRFNLLLSMFDKKQPENKDAGSRPVGKLDSNKFNAFNNKEEGTQDKKKYMDPILEARRDRLHTEPVQEDEEEPHNESGNLNISEESDNEEL